MINFTPFEESVLAKLLAGDDPVLKRLSSQLQNAKAASREHTGVGQYIDITFTNPVQAIDGEPSFRFGDVRAEVDGVPNGVGVQLWIDRGLMREIEIYTYQEEWPAIVQKFSLSYDTGGERDLEALRCTVGWPEGGVAGNAVSDS